MQEMSITQSPFDSAEVFPDPGSDPSNPIEIPYADIPKAADAIKSGIVRTPCERSRLSDLFGIELYLKKDFMQYTGNFKERGARYALMMLNDEQKKMGVTAASAGNHGQAVCYHGKLLGIPVTVVMPLTAPIMKVTQCQNFGAAVKIQGSNLAECKQIALRIAKEEGKTFINGYDHPHVVAGQGSIGLEVLEQVPDIDAIVLPIGGGGLLAGAGLACKSLKPSMKIIGAESVMCPGFSASMAAGKPTLVKAESTLADGLAVPLIGCNIFKTISKHVYKVAVVKEESIAMAILRFIEVEKCVVEGAGAVTLAAVIEGQLNEFKGKKVCLVLSGGNIDTSVLGRCLERGLAADDRLVKATICVSDRPGGISELIDLMATLDVNIKDVFQERAWVAHDVFSVDITCICETKNTKHSEQLRMRLKAGYKKVLIH